MQLGNLLQATLTHVTSSGLAFSVTVVAFLGHVMQPLSWDTASVSLNQSFLSESL